MVRPRSTVLLGVLAAGCVGQTVEGTWRGAFPLDGTKVCEMRLHADRSASVQCDGSAVVGGGHYAWDGVRLELTLSVLTYGGQKVAQPEPYVFKIQGEGNVLRAASQGQVYEWRRTMK